MIYDDEEGYNSYGDDKLTWKEMLYLIPLVPVFIYGIAYVWTMDKIMDWWSK